MTISEPIPVAEAIKAVKAALETVSAASRAPWYAYGGYLSSRASISGTIYHLDELGQRNSPSPIQAIPFHRHEDAKAVACARAILPGSLEYLLETVNFFGNDFGVDAITREEQPALYAAVAPIVEWYRQSGAQGGAR